MNLLNLSKKALETNLRLQGKRLNILLSPAEAEKFSLISSWHTEMKFVL